MILLIGGHAESGKDTFAKILKNKLEQKNKKCLIVHFADYLKLVCKLYFGWDGNKDEVGREILQRVGTDLIRARDENFWVKVVADLISVLKNDYDYFLIPDWRFKSEAEYFYNTYLEDFDCNFFTVRINRTDYQNTLTPEQRLHRSETDLDDYVFNFIIDCESGIDKLEEKVNKFITYLDL